MLSTYAQDSTPLPEEHFSGSFCQHFTTHLDLEVRAKVNPSLETIATVHHHGFFADARENAGSKWGAVNQVYCYANFRPIKFEVKRAQNDTRWMFFVINSIDSDGPAPLDATLDGINTLIGKRDFVLLNRFLRIVPTDSANRYALLGLARATFPVRTKLKDWQSFVENCYVAFNARGLDAAKLLKGLH